MLIATRSVSSCGAQTDAQHVVDVGCGGCEPPRPLGGRACPNWPPGPMHETVIGVPQSRRSRLTSTVIRYMTPKWSPEQGPEHKRDPGDDEGVGELRHLWRVRGREGRGRAHVASGEGCFGRHWSEPIFTRFAHDETVNHHSRGSPFRSLMVKRCSRSVRRCSDW